MTFWPLFRRMRKACAPSSSNGARLPTKSGADFRIGGLSSAWCNEPQGKRSRCAMVKPAATTAYLQVPWTWNANVFFAAATGARAFFARQEYAHGGISPQECVLPILDVSAGAVIRQVSIVRAAWDGLRLRVEVTDGADLRVDVLLGAETSGASLIKGGRVLDDKGRTSVLINDIHEGKQACLVVLNEDGAVLAHRLLTVGGE
jgi:hypothetical protein